MIGVWTFILMTAFTFGITKGYVDNAIRYQTSHLQIHHPQYVADKEVQYTISKVDLPELSAMPEIAHVTRRVLVQGMIKSSRGARGITIRGVDPSAEESLMSISEKTIEVSFFDDNKKNQIVLGSELADKLKVKVRKKVVLQFIDKDGEIVAGSFRVAGLYKTGNRGLDNFDVFVRHGDLQQLLKMENAYHEVIIQLSDPRSDLKAMEDKLSADFDHLMVENYRAVAPDVELYESQIYISISVLLVIFMLALIFGIINTMLMAVLERTKELGMLMAVGMNKARVFWMIVSETLLLGLIGAPLGLVAGYLSVKLLRRTGIDLSGFAEGAERFGIQTTIRPFIENQIYVQLMLAVFFTALLASIYPAIRAIRLRPMEAIRKI